MAPSERVSLFDRWAHHYDNSVTRNHEFPFDGYEQVLDRVAATSGAKPGMTVLDLGIGTGTLARRFIDLPGVQFVATS